MLFRKRRQLLLRAPCKNGFSTFTQRQLDDEFGGVAVGAVDENVVVHGLCPDFFKLLLAPLTRARVSRLLTWVSGSCISDLGRVGLRQTNSCEFGKITGPYRSVSYTHL